MICVRNFFCDEVLVKVGVMEFGLYKLLLMMLFSFVDVFFQTGLQLIPVLMGFEISSVLVV